MRAVIAADGSYDRDQYRVAALGAGLDCQANDCVPVAELPERLKREPVADLVLVGLAGDAALTAIAQVAAVARVVPVAVGPVRDAELVRRATDAGARRYLDEDQLPEQLAEALESLGREGVVNLRRGKVIAVTSALPGSGVTTIAGGLAFALAAEKVGTVGLAEPGTGVPQLALNLNLKPTHGLNELVRLTQRADASMVKGAAVDHPSGVSVIAYPPETLAPEPVGADQAHRLFPVLRAAYDWVVLDLGHGMTDGNEVFLSRADRVIVVTRQDVPAVRLTRKFLKAVAVTPDDRLILLANRYGQAGHLAWKVVEESLNRPVREWVPDDPAGVNAAVAAGQPLAARGSSVHKCLVKLARGLVGELKAARR
jgi:pilus assembly protein CpaE